MLHSVRLLNFADLLFLLTNYTFFSIILNTKKDTNSPKAYDGLVDYEVKAYYRVKVLQNQQSDPVRGGFCEK